MILSGKYYGIAIYVISKVSNSIINSWLHGIRNFNHFDNLYRGYLFKNILLLIKKAHHEDFLNSSNMKCLSCFLDYIKVFISCTWGMHKL